MRWILVSLLIFVCGSAAQMDDYSEATAKSLLPFAAAAYCPAKNIVNWNCAACSMAPGFRFLGGTTSLLLGLNITAYIGVDESKQIVVMAFEGSQDFTQIWDQVIESGMTPHPTIPGALVMTYFMQYYIETAPLLESVMTSVLQNYSSYQVYVTGHSLGGALAVLAAASMVQSGVLDSDSTTVYTYGQPRVGDYGFAKAAQANIRTLYRLIHFNDPVPHIPPCTSIAGLCTTAGFYHVKTEVWYYTESMGSYRVCTGIPYGEDKTCSNLVPVYVDLTDHTHYFGMHVGQSC